MDVTTFIWLYLISVPIFFAVDMLWLGWLARDFYQRQIGTLLGNVKWSAAIGFYLLYLVGVVFFAVYPAVLSESIAQAALLGGLFGFFTYATYDMTNLATLRGWTVKVTVVDILWGAVLGASVATGTAYVWLQLFA